MRFPCPTPLLNRSSEHPTSGSIGALTSAARLCLLGLLFTQSCSRNATLDLGPASMASTYQQDHEQWLEDRHTSLTEPYGWMRLAGMYWLHPGRNSFGSDPSNDLIFPSGKIPGRAGWFILREGSVWMESADDVRFLHEGRHFETLVLFEMPTGEEATGSLNGEVAIEYGTLRWTVIKRGDRLGIRLYDAENAVADAFTGFESYPIQPEWYLKAYFKAENGGRTIAITTILGQVDQIPVAGTLTFEKDGVRHTLVATDSGESLFVIIADPTNQTETYGAGRYIYVDRPSGSESGMTVLDFNKLYNPPCAYTKYSTCQLPPLGNQLSLPITAGEKKPRPDQIP